MTDPETAGTAMLNGRDRLIDDGVGAGSETTVIEETIRMIGLEDAARALLIRGPVVETAIEENPQVDQTA